MTEWYPVMLNIKGKLCVVIGGGAVAERKIAGLLEAGGHVRIVSPRLVPTLLHMARQGRLEWHPREAAESDLEGAALVFAATDNPAVNRRIAASARESGIPVNVADAGETGDFVLPAVLRRGPFVLTASLSGAGPALAARVIRELADRYGEEYAEYAEALRRIRTVVKTHVPDPEERRKLLTAAADEESLDEWRTADWISDVQRLLQRLRERVAARHD
jgi:precorrin-2 dehydrogenase/sirohydrochlorin ferrochelatase